MLRVIAGELGGRSLQSPSTTKTRPVTDKTRAAIFSTIGEAVKEAKVLDLYAGSGALGIEALSRGAASLDLVESSHQAQKIIATNLKDLAIDKLARLHHSSAEHYLKSDQGQYDLIFFDPPYAKFEVGLAEAARDLLKSDGVLVVSCSSKTDYRPSSMIDQRVYGDTMITYLKK